MRSTTEVPLPDPADTAVLLYQQIVQRAARALVVDDQVAAADLLALLPLRAPDVVIALALGRAVLAAERSEPWP